MSNVVQLDSKKKPDPLEEAVYASPTKLWVTANTINRVSAIAKIRRRLERDTRAYRPFVSEAYLCAAIASLATAENMLLRGAVNDCAQYFTSVQDAFTKSCFTKS
jgi:hypothetical protein